MASSGAHPRLKAETLDVETGKLVRRRDYARVGLERCHLKGKEDRAALKQFIVGEKSTFTYCLIGPAIVNEREVRVHFGGSESQNHRFFLKYPSTPTIEKTMSALAYRTPCGLLLQGRCRFMPKKPVITTSGTASVP